MKKSKIKSTKEYPNLKIIIKGLPLVVRFEKGMVDPEDEKQIKRIVKLLGNEICIDYSYVNFPGNCHEDKFVTPEGWQELIKLLHETEMGKYATKKEAEFMDASFIALSLAYMEMILSKIYGYDLDFIEFGIKSNKKVSISFFVDDCKELEMYNKIYNKLWNGED